MTTIETSLIELADTIDALQPESQEITVATRYISSALRSSFAAAIRGSHMEKQPVPEIAAFIVDGAALQLVSNLVSPDVMGKTAQSHGTSRSARIVVDNIKDVIVARDRAMRVVDASSAQSTLQ
jgi:hypothetical protein